MKRILIIIWTVFLALGVSFMLVQKMPAPPVKVGILHSRTGTMAVSENPVAEATLLAVAEINRKGGVLGRQIEVVEADGKSDPGQFALAARRLIDQDQVAVIFGCWTSASRKEVKTVVEAANHLLVYPVQYEGVESSPSIIYTGSVPNQQIKPAVKWALDNLGSRFYLVGSDYIFPRIANTMIRDLAGFLGATITGERYVPLAAINFSDIAKEIAHIRPDVVFNTLNGDSNLAFFAALDKEGLHAADVPVFSFSVDETQLKSMLAKLDAKALVGHYAAWSYFQTFPGKENEAFLKLISAGLGKEQRISDPMVSAYVGVRLWAQAVEEAGSFEPAKVHRAFARQSINGPAGIVYIDDDNYHAWKAARIGRVNDHGLFDIVWDSHRPISPAPYPSYADRNSWQLLEKKFYGQWGNRWGQEIGGEQ